MVKILLIVLIGLVTPTKTFGSPDLIQQLWENNVTPCKECTEIAMGTYHRDGAKKPLTLLCRSQNGDGGTDSTAIHLNFLNPRGDKYVIVSVFHPQIDKVETRQVALLPDIDPDRARVISPSLYEELRETNINPLFLTLSLHLVKKYSAVIHHGEEIQAVVDKKARYVLPHEIYVRVEKQGGYVAPVEVQMYRDKVVISTIRMKNAMVNGRLRPFWISLTSRGKTDEISIDFWGMVKNNHEYFTPTGVGRGELSIPEISAKVSCPPEICKK